MAMPDLLGEAFERIQQEVDSAFDAFLPVPDDTRARLIEAMRYASLEVHSAWNAILLGGAYLSRGMPAFEGVLTEEDAEAIRAYIVRQAQAIGSE